MRKTLALRLFKDIQSDVILMDLKFPIKNHLIL